MSDRYDETASSSKSDGDGAARVRQLVVVYGAVANGSSLVPLVRDRVTIGREPLGPGSLPLNDSQVSREHAVVEHDDTTSTWSIVDRGSRNGTIVDGVRVERATLVHGSVVRVGQSLIVMADVELRAGDRLEPETPRLCGTSLVAQRLRGEIALVAPRPLPVFVLGETGVGKECVAHEIHRLSGRQGAWVPVNCAAIPDALAESELFGHSAGAFTGATQRTDGVFVAADGGTLFLDEIGDLPAVLQPKLLRVLSASEVRALGKVTARKVDVRVVAATHRDPSAAVHRGGLREDLFARLSGWTIRVPPLRERREDILRLARAILQRAGHTGKLSASAAESLLLGAWPMNVRGLEQVLAVAAVRAQKSSPLRREHLPEELTAKTARGKGRTSGPAAPLEASVPRDAVPSESDLRLVLRHYGGTVARVAEYFGKDRHQVYRWAEHHGIDLSTYRSNGEPAKNDRSTVTS